MNQILVKPQKNSLKYIYFLVFFLSVFIVFYGFFNIFILEQAKMNRIITAKKISQSYSLSKLYASKPVSNSNNKPFIIGILSIPSINLNLPVMSEISDDLLSVSLCRFYGPTEQIPRQYLHCWP